MKGENFMKSKAIILVTSVALLLAAAIGILVKGDFLNEFKEGEKYVKGMFPQEGSITIQDNQIYFNDEKMTTDSDKNLFQYYRQIKQELPIIFLT